VYREETTMDGTRRQLLLAAGSLGAAAVPRPASAALPRPGRRFRYVHVDVFAATPLAGNPLDVFVDATGMSDDEMLAVTRETYLSEATFVFPRDAAIERERGVRVRIFTPEGEVPFAGHPTLGTAMVLRGRRGIPAAGAADEVVLDLNVGRVPVSFRAGTGDLPFGEMRQVAPRFGAVHDRATVARLVNLAAGEITDEGPIETVSTGLPFAIVPLKSLSVLQSLRIDAPAMDAYTARQDGHFGFYYVTRDTGDPDVAFRARCLYVGGEDAATGSAAGCFAAWLVRHGLAEPGRPQRVRQGVEMRRPSDLYVRAGRDGADVVDVRVGGYAVRTMEGELIL
jgi:trans-2,3-dihydro-3-hydroxyanthranilate isomerase